MPKSQPSPNMIALLRRMSIEQRLNGGAVVEHFFVDGWSHGRSVQGAVKRGLLIRSKEGLSLSDEGRAALLASKSTGVE